MKVKALRDIGEIRCGDVAEAVVSPSGARAFLFDKENNGWFLNMGEFEALPEDTKPVERDFSLAKLLGQEVSEIRFK